MENPNHIFQCLLCKKYRSINNLEMLFNDGSPMCKNCGDDIRSGFSYYINGKEYTKEDFDKKIKDKDDKDNV